MLVSVVDDLPDLANQNNALADFKVVGTIAIYAASDFASP
jgi:hypothetical protein